MHAIDRDTGDAMQACAGAQARHLLLALRPGWAYPATPYAAITTKACKVDLLMCQMTCDYPLHEEFPLFQHGSSSFL